MSASLLLDTHVFLWWDAAKLPKAVVARIQAAPDVYVSAASAWEVAIKAALGKVIVRGEFAQAVRDYGFTPLAISIEHADAVKNLPSYHRDPFDRLLVTQARMEGLALVTRDPVLAQYPVTTLWE